jgi:hypothetical protein
LPKTLQDQYICYYLHPRKIFKVEIKIYDMLYFLERRKIIVSVYTIFARPMKGGRKRSRPFVISHSKEGVGWSVRSDLAYKDGNRKITSHEILGKREHKRKRIFNIKFASSP